MIFCLTDEACEIILIEIGKFPSVFEAVAVLWVAHEVHGDMFDDRHVVRAVCGSEPCEIVMEDDIEHPVQPVFDPPVGSFGMREGLGFELCRREIVAPLALASASALDAGLEHADHGQKGKARFISEAQIREQPSDVMADQMAGALPSARSRSAAGMARKTS